MTPRPPDFGRNVMHEKPEKIGSQAGYIRAKGIHIFCRNTRWKCGTDYRLRPEHA